MRLLEELRAEHELIDRVAGSLRTFAAARARGEGDPADGAAFRRFFRLWAGAWHHAREEETLFPALAAKAELSPSHGPIAAFVEQHRDMASVVLELDGRAPSPEELEARVEGERLASAWPFTVDAGGVRGEGCVVCPSYGTTCNGVETEWWNESEWEEFSDHLG